MRRDEAEFALLPWGEGVRVTKKLVAGIDFLQIEAESINPDEAIPLAAVSGKEARNLLPLLLNRDSNWGNPDRRTGEPHLRFASADTDEKLMEFVKDFGPVQGVSDVPGEYNPLDPEDETEAYAMARREALAGGGDPSLARRAVRKAIRKAIRKATKSPVPFTPGGRGIPAAAEEDLVELRAERVRFASVLRLISLLKDRTFDKKAVMEAVAAIDESFSRALAYPSRRFPVFPGKSEVRVLGFQEERVLQALYDFLEPYRFPIQVMSGGPRGRAVPVRLPRRTGRNFLPVLYGLLFRELEGPGLPPRTCQNKRCGTVFRPDRINQKYCHTKCGWRDASRKHYASKGRQRRADRRKAPSGHEEGQPHPSRTRPNAPRKGASRRV